MAKLSLWITQNLDLIGAAAAILAVFSFMLYAFGLAIVRWAR